MALARWALDPEVFAREVLGVRAWRRQAEILHAVRTHKRVAVRSGQKCGKTLSIAVLALWFVCVHRNARVIFTAASARQVRSVVWREIRRLYKRAAKRGRPIGGELHKNPEAGLVFKDEREIIGFSTDDPERFAGYSGENLLFIVDEASGVEEPIFAAIEGNRAGGARFVMISNPTRTEGAFFDAFHGKAGFWHPIHISSEEAAAENAANDNAIRGLAEQENINDWLAEWGEDSPFYQVRVKGNFPAASNDTVIPLSFALEAVGRWSAKPSDEDAKERLNIGVDVARFGGDHTVIVCRRGKWTSRPIVLLGFDVVDVSSAVLGAVTDHARAGERPSIKIDSAVMGAGVVDILKRNPDLSVHAVSSSSSSEDEQVSRLRDQLWLGMRQWLKAGGSIADDAKLQSDICAPKYTIVDGGKMKVESKKELRRRIGRSTDRGDALALAIHEVADEDAWSPIFEELGRSAA